MYSKRLFAGILFAVVGAGVAWADDPEILVPLQFTNLPGYETVAYGFGLDPNALDGLDADPYEFDVMLPPPPPGPSGNKAAFMAGGWPLARDVRQLRDGVDSYYWRLDVDIADPTNADTLVTLSWDTAHLTALDFDNAELRTAPTGGTLLKDMKSQNSHLFTDDATVYIVLSREAQPYFPPFARDDGPFSVFIERSITIQVLANDDGSNLAVVADPAPTVAGATAVRVSNNQAVQYTAPASVEKPETGWPAVDVFEYTITDGIEQATATITVHVYGEVFAGRRHAPLAKTGDDGGLKLGVDVTYDPNTVKNFIRYSEIMPWRPASGGRSATSVWQPMLDDNDQPVVTMLVGPDPDIRTYDGTTFELILQWNLGGRDRDLGELSFEVELVNDDPNATGDTEFTQGQITYEDDQGTTLDFAMDDSGFQAREQLFHSADYDGNWQIGVGEILRVLELYNSGGFYQPDAATADGYAPTAAAPAAQSGYHSADYDRNWQISVGEILRVLELYNGGGFYESDTSTADGYAPVMP